jgi:hypothetical protein
MKKMALLLVAIRPMIALPAVAQTPLPQSGLASPAPLKSSTATG